MTSVSVLPARFATIKNGGHTGPADGGCLLEIVSYVAGEPWSDHPHCVCPVLAAFGRAWNDGLPDDETRTRLLAPFIPLLVGTRSTPAVEGVRAWMAVDWLVRVCTPVWLRAAGLDAHAAALADLPPLIDTQSALAATLALDAAGAAGVARVARVAEAVDEIVQVAAAEPVWAAARAAVWAALEPTGVQVSAVDLYHRMIACTA